MKIWNLKIQISLPITSTFQKWKYIFSNFSNFNTVTNTVHKWKFKFYILKFKCSIKSHYCHYHIGKIKVIFFLIFQILIYLLPHLRNKSFNFFSKLKSSFPSLQCFRNKNYFCSSKFENLSFIALKTSRFNGYSKIFLEKRHLIIKKKSNKLLKTGWNRPFKAVKTTVF